MKVKEFKERLRRASEVFDNLNTSAFKLKPNYDIIVECKPYNYSCMANTANYWVTVRLPEDALNNVEKISIYGKTDYEFKHFKALSVRFKKVGCELSDKIVLTSFFDYGNELYHIESDDPAVISWEDIELLENIYNYLSSEEEETE